MRLRNRTRLLGIVLGCVLSIWTPRAHATSFERQNLADLIHHSELILTGTVTGLTDGFDRGVPYTEVSVAVDEAVRGKPSGTYTFRQFGLLAPRRLESGRTYLGISPDGWPRFAVGEDVVLFLYKPGSKTGFRTTVGLLQGKFQRTDRHLENGMENVGLMSGLSVDPGLLTPAEQKLLQLKKGPIDAEVFLSLVRKAVDGRWIETGKLRHVR